MVRYAILVGPLVSFGLSGLAAPAAEVSLTVHPDRVLNRIDEKVYGQFLEHIYHSCNGGLWGDLVWNRSFEGGSFREAWQVRDGVLAQEGYGTNIRLTFGDRTWTDYEFTVGARKTGGDEGFLILLRVLSGKAFYWANLGGWGNVGHALERGTESENRWRAVTPRRPGRIETGRWYRIRARCQGRRVQVWLDGDPVIDYTDDGGGPKRGCVGLGTWATQAQFRNPKIVALDGQALFQGLPSLPRQTNGAAPHWTSFGQVTVSASSENPLNGTQCRKVIATGAGGGLEQGGMCIHAGEVYRGSLWLRGKASGGLVARLRYGDRVLAEEALPAPSSAWGELPVALKPTASCDDARLQIGVRGVGTVWLDQVSLMPESWRKAGGFRPDLLQAVADLHPPVIRWPGGCFASSYRWKWAIGAQHKRRFHPRVIWDDRDVYSFGTDEFIALCRKVGAEPLIVVNIGTPQWNDATAQRDAMQDVLDWIEYCNGPADSKWGRVRAANGHSEPYGVKYWEIDNETWHLGPERYAEYIERFAPAMRKVDPAIRLIACGSAGYGEGGNGLAWNRLIIERCADKIDYLSIHHYEGPDRFADGPVVYERFFQRTGELIAASKNPSLKIYVSEWNAQSTDWRTGLYCGGILNAFERCGNIVEMAGPALFLRHVTATAWDNAFINFDQCRWFPAPNYVVMKLWRDHYAPLRIAVEGESTPLNLSAARSEDGKTVYIKAVNPSKEKTTVRLAFPTGVAAKDASMETVAPGSLQACNTLDSPHAVRAVPARVDRKAGSLQFELPALSAGVVTLRLR